MRALIRLLAALACTLPLAADQDGGRGPGGLPTPRSGERGFELPLERRDPLEAALERGLAFLAKSQARTPGGELPSTPGEHEAPLGVTALGAMAWMAGGSSLTRGPYRAELERAVRYLLDHQLREGEHIGYFTDTEDRASRTHGHGLATLALAQAFAVSPRTSLGERIATALSLAVQRIEESQGVDGGWYYDPWPTTDHEGSVTVCLVWALRGARNVGVHVEGEVIERAVEYVKSLQAEDGGFMYAKHQRDTSVALTAASLSTLHAMGMYEGALVDDAYGYIWRRLEARDLDRERGARTLPMFPFYERMYLAQALWQHPDPDVFWRWARHEQVRVLGTQEPDGSWQDVRYARDGGRIGGRYGTAYATAANCLFLAVPLSSLPIYTR